MKIKTTTLDKIATLLFFVLLTLATVCFGVKSRLSLSLHNDDSKAQSSPYELFSFKAKQADNINYINWILTSSQNNYCFVLERSLDGETYSIIDIRKGYKSPSGQKLQFSFADKNIPNSGYVHYRLKLHEIQGIEIENGRAILSSENMLEKNESACIVLGNTYNETSQLIQPHK